MKDDIKGLNKLEKQLEAISNADYLPALEKGVRRLILPEMQRLTPVDEGELRDSEGVEIIKDNVVLFANAEHAVFVELGTIYQEAQSYMRSAIDAKKDDAMRVTADEVEMIMEKVIR